jgi:hypothetical protein
MTRTEALAAALTCICGDRDEQYGSPEENFSQIAALWSVYLDEEIGPEDVACMMTLFKIARIEGSNYASRDSWIDAIGYMACGAEIATEEAEDGRAE